MVGGPSTFLRGTRRIRSDRAYPWQQGSRNIGVLHDSTLPGLFVIDLLYCGAERKKCGARDAPKTHDKICKSGIPYQTQDVWSDMWALSDQQADFIDQDSRIVVIKRKMKLMISLACSIGE